LKNIFLAKLVCVFLEVDEDVVSVLEQYVPKYIVTHLYKMLLSRLVSVLLKVSSFLFSFVCSARRGKVRSGGSDTK
jgi:hypothetical protein